MEHRTSVAVVLAAASLVLPGVAGAQDVTPDASPASASPAPDPVPGAAKPRPAPRRAAVTPVVRTAPAITTTSNATTAVATPAPRPVAVRRVAAPRRTPRAHHRHVAPAPSRPVRAAPPPTWPRAVPALEHATAQRDPWLAEAGAALLLLALASGALVLGVARGWRLRT